MKLQIIKNMGLRWTVYRAQYEIKKKIGYLKKHYKPVNYEDILINTNLTTDEIKKEIESNLSELKITNNFQINDDDFNKLLERSKHIFNNEFRYFFTDYYEYAGWNYTPKKDTYIDNDKHWSEISDFDNKYGDIKWVWELSRFTFTYDLVRLYLYTNDDKYVEKFWELFESFIEENPLEIGPNYKCSQEMSFRANAWLFAIYHLLRHPLTTDERFNAMLKQLIHYTDHINKHIRFSIESVQNNHSISETTTLFVLGNTLNFINGMDKYKNRGLRLLKKEIAWQIREDGSYIQNSHNYHRLVLQDLNWFLMSYKSTANSTKIPRIIKKKSQKSIDFFRAIINKKGIVPNYGMDDGSYILPLSENDYKDYRPVLQCLNYQINGELIYENLINNEYLHLMNQVENLDLEKQLTKEVDFNSFQDGSYHIIKFKKFKVYLKAGTYKTRPVQADMNHIDIWYEGSSIFQDGGTYSYNENEEILDYFHGTKSHNTVLIDDKNQMDKGSRFIWYNWSKSLPLKWEIKKDYIKVENTLLNYGPNTHKRVITVYEDRIVINDIIKGNKLKGKQIELQWLTELSNNTDLNKQILYGEKRYSLEVSSKQELTPKIFKGSNKPFRGWISNKYGKISPASQFVYSLIAENNEEKINSIIRVEN
ncbi:hypothetical protein BUY94_12580 [Mammaliicoccus fleurettii]|uniref:heparinase II/III domain-containing protein n=1 Tax=Mammaliicoccus fleurettii TaxID=150056 RepID=UPI000D1C98C6|nr:heparinase II/III family protein [Mammaliicoccus fleurettii]PTE31152.1 hypothetical protein BUY94_12580 [Mammaliicoccus fleurettii]